MLTSVSLKHTSIRWVCCKKKEYMQEGQDTAPVAPSSPSLSSSSSLLRDNDDAANFPSTFPKAFVAYCQANNISSSVFQNVPWDCIRNTRYIRIRPSLTAHDHQQRRLVVEAISGAQAVPWLPCQAFRIPRSIPMAELKNHQEYVCPMDAASMAAVVALQVQAGDRVLDLCCCPGMKSLLIADALLSAYASGKDDGSLARSNLGSVVGVDVNIDRLMVARSLIASKYKMQHAVSLVCCDGRFYDPSGMMAGAIASASMDPKAVEQRVKNARKFADRERKRQRERVEQLDNIPPPAVPSPYFVLFSDAEAAVLKAFKANQNPTSLLFDKVLVDVECTHDGSLFHLDLPADPPGASGEEEGEKRSSASIGITNTHRMERMNYMGASDEHNGKVGSISEEDGNHSSSGASSELHALQLNLLARGFECLKPGGILVYSTCSFSVGQNEAIVESFMKALHCGKTELVCVPLVPFAPRHSAKADDVAPLLSLQSAATAHALSEVMTLTTQSIDVDLAA
ncbi:Hypothetical protein, putative, partial [Bodo saltans]